MRWDALSDTLQRRPEALAFVEKGAPVSRAAFLDQVSTAAAVLRQSGVRSGDCAAVALPNSVAGAAAIVACLRDGIRCLLLDHHLKPADLAAYRTRAGARCIWTSDATPVSVGQEAGEPARGGQAGILFLSSGTTGRPKLVYRTPAQIEAAFDIFRSRLPLNEQDRVAATLPFCHSFGLVFVLLSSLRAGATLYLDEFTPRALVHAIEAQRISVLPATPFMLRMMAQTRFSPAPNLRSVRLAVAVGSALPASIASAFHAAFGVGVTQTYGTTESGPIAVGPPGEQRPDPGWVGRAYDGVTVHAPTLAGRPRDAAACGSIVVSSPAAATGYVDAPAATAAVFRPNGVVTGDLGYRDPDGHVYVLGRERPLINVAGKKVAPSEVEACLRTHPMVADVVVSALAVGDGEQVRATIVPRAPVTALVLQQHCAEHLAGYKIPRTFVFVEHLAEGPMGKARVPGSASPS